MLAYMYSYSACIVIVSFVLQLEDWLDKFMDITADDEIHKVLLLSIFGGFSSLIAVALSAAVLVIVLCVSKCFLDREKDPPLPVLCLVRRHVKEKSV